MPRRQFLQEFRHIHPVLECLDAADRDYRGFVVADATAEPEPGVHGFLTERVFPRQAQVITVAQLDGLLSGTDGRSR